MRCALHACHESTHDTKLNQSNVSVVVCVLVFETVYHPTQGLGHATTIATVTVTILPQDSFNGC